MSDGGLEPIVEAGGRQIDIELASATVLDGIETACRNRAQDAGEEVNGRSLRLRLTKACPAAAHPFGARLAGAGREM